MVKKKNIALLLTFILLPALLSGCENTDTSGTQSASSLSSTEINADPVIKKVDIEEALKNCVKTGDEDLDRAIFLGLVKEEDVSTDKNIKGSEAFNIINSMLELVSPEAARSFAKKFAGFRVRSTDLNRLEGIVLTFEAGRALGEDYIYVSNWAPSCNLLTSLDWEAQYENIRIATELGASDDFMLYDEIWGRENYAVLFAVGRYDIYTGKSLFSYDDKEGLRSAENLSYYDMVRAAVRLYDSVAGTGGDDFMIAHKGGTVENFRIMINGEQAGMVFARKLVSEWQIYGKDASEIFKAAGFSSAEEYVNLRDIAQKLDYSFEPDDKLEAAYFWTNIKYADSPSVPAYLINGYTLEKEVCAPLSFTVHTQMIPVTDARVLAPDSTIVTPELINYAKERAATAEPEKMSGFALPTVMWQTHKIGVTETDLRLIANWGFNTALILLDWQDFFDNDMEEIDLDELNTLDTLIATAMKYDIRLVLQFLKEPGRWIQESGANYGGDYELDLYVNPDNQAKCEKMWRLFAKRYKDIPGRTLYFSPVWEPLNKRLSSTHEAPEYGTDEYVKVFIRLAKAINEESPERVIFLDPADLNNPEYYVRTADDKRKNLNDEYFSIASTILSAGVKNMKFEGCFIGMAYVYGEMLPDTIDDVGLVNVDLMTHSMFKPDYPVVIYGANKYITPEMPMTIDGFLPAGTKIVVYAKTGYGKLSVLADKERLYEESFDKSMDFKTNVLLSMYYTYAKSEHPIEITLGEEKKEIRIESDGFFEWSGIDVILPEEYAVERWYYYSVYDNFLETGEDFNKKAEKRLTSDIIISPNLENEGSHITVEKDVSFKSDVILNETTPESIETFMGFLAERNITSSLRFENDEFNLGASFESELRYYDDILTACNKHGIGWCSNDYCYMNGYTYGKLAGLPQDYYAGNSEFNIALLKLLQKHQ